MRPLLLDQHLIGERLFPQRRIDLFHIRLGSEEHQGPAVGNPKDLKQPLDTLLNKCLVFPGRVRQVLAVVDQPVLVIGEWRRLRLREDPWPPAGKPVLLTK